MTRLQLSVRRAVRITAAVLVVLSLALIAPVVTAWPLAGLAIAAGLWALVVHLELRAARRSVRS